MAELMTVVAGNADGRVALWERDPAHPGGEVFIAGNGGPAVRVARTPAVLRALALGLLVPVTEPVAEPVAEPVKPASASTHKRKTAQAAGRTA
jgi:hypothetical protein